MAWAFLLHAYFFGLLSLHIWPDSLHSPTLFQLLFFFDWGGCVYALSAGPPLRANRLFFFSSAKTSLWIISFLLEFHHSLTLCGSNGPRDSVVVIVVKNFFLKYLFCGAHACFFSCPLSLVCVSPCPFSPPRLLLCSLLCSAQGFCPRLGFYAFFFSL